jgi:hypothetical protein
MSKISDHLHSKIEGLRVSYMLLAGMSEVDAERKAIQEVKAEQAKAKPNKVPNKVQPTTPTSSHVDSETKRAAVECRLAELVEQWGFK